MSSSVRKRKKNDVSGNLSNFKVLASNCMNENTSILLAVALFFRCFIVLENPSGSYYFKYETCAALAEIFKLTRLTMWMRAFGGIYPKPTWLLTNIAEWQRLRQIWSKKREEEQKKEFRRSMMRISWLWNLFQGHKFKFARKDWQKRRWQKKTVKVKWVNGRKQVTGNPANLKESGEYPVGYATVLLSVWQRCPSRAPKVDLSLSEILGFLPFPSGGIYQATLPTESFPIADAFAAPAGFTELLTRMNNS